MLTNARSVFNKIDEIQLIKATLSPSIIAITESWLHSSIDSALLAITDYLFFRDDRVTRKGGGVCLWCHKRFCPELLPTNPIAQIEHLLIYLSTIDCLLVLAYIPPALSAFDHSLIDTYLTHLIDDHLLVHPNSNIIFCGDFNNHNTSELESSFSLLNVVTQPTRLGSFLDKILISTNLIHRFAEPSILPPIASSDHCVVFIKPLFNFDYISGSRHTVYDFRRSFIDRYVNALSCIDFTPMYKTPDLNSKPALFYDCLRTCIDVIPRNEVILTPNDKPWISPLLKHLINQRWTAYRNKDFARYNHLKVKIKKEILHAKMEW